MTTRPVWRSQRNSPSLEMMVLNDFMKSHNPTPGEIHSIRITNVDDFTFDHTVEKDVELGELGSKSFCHTSLPLRYCN